MLSKEIKEYGAEIGYGKVGISSADGFPEYVEEVLSRGNDFDFLKFASTNPLSGAMPKNIMPEAKSVIVMIWDYFQNDFPEDIKKMIGKIYLARCYNPLPGTSAHSRLKLMKDFLADKGLQVNSDIGLPARWAAFQAGVATFGKNNFAYADGSGSYIVINTIVVDKELDYDQPGSTDKCPSNCKACMEACPTKAIYAPYKLNPLRCISFNNWMAQDGRGAVSSFIPYEIRESIGSKIHGCDICQDVCPRNQKKLKAPKPADSFIETIAADINLSAVLSMNDDFYSNKIRPIMYNYLKDKRYFQRNAAIAMGNSHNPAYVNDLSAAMLNPDGMVRSYAAWALGTIGGQASKAELEKALSRESDDGVKQAVGHALAKCDMK